MTFRLAIVGRPNVGKSTLFNRLVGRRIAIVDDRPGVTRDLREGEARLGPLRFTAIDTAGLEEASDDSLPARMRRLTERAVAEADACLFVIDARVGVTATDQLFAGILRKRAEHVILVANKAEGRAGDEGYYDSYGLGLGEPVPISAEHNEGMDLLLDALAPVATGFGADEAEEGADKPLRIAVIGRPNAGKSTLINRIVGDDRLLTGPEAGITRDSIALGFDWGGRAVKLFDTAGMRKRARVVDKLEKLSVGDGLRAVRFAEVVVLLLDAAGAFETQDLRIADLAEREGRAVVIAVNKWDLVEDRQARLAALKEQVTRLLPQLRGVPLVTLSAGTGRGLERLREAVLKAETVWNTRVPTAALNRWLAETVARHPPPAPGGRRLKLRYITQSTARPPTFILFCQRAEEVPEAYRRYLVNGLRDAFGLMGTPVRVHLRKGENPFAGKR